MFYSKTALAIYIIRDTEIENFIADIADPMSEAAGLPLKSINFYIVRNDSVNAFVYNGDNIFLHTGLIELSEDPSMFIGVIAHEIGHIYADHLSGKKKEYKKANINALLSYVLGMAAIASGSADVGQAVIFGSDHLLQRNLLSHSRLQEQEADKIALKILDQLQYPATGLLKLFEYLSRQTVIEHGRVNPYAQTHPLSIERTSVVKDHINDDNKNYVISKDIEYRYRKIWAKICAYMNDY
ncbi:MAG: M48 family metalloprotease, partial [Pseudomonadota bacterium]